MLDIGRFFQQLTTTVYFEMIRQSKGLNNSAFQIVKKIAIQTASQNITFLEINHGKSYCQLPNQWGVLINRGQKKFQNLIIGGGVKINGELGI